MTQYLHCRRISYTLDGLCPLGVQLIGVASVGLLLAVFQTRAGVGFQHSVLGTEMPLTEAAVADDSLGELLTLLVAAAWLARRSHGEEVVARGAEKEVFRTLGRLGVVGREL